MPFSRTEKGLIYQRAFGGQVRPINSVYHDSDLVPFLDLTPSLDYPLSPTTMAKEDKHIVAVLLQIARATLCFILSMAK